MYTQYTMQCRKSTATVDLINTTSDCIETDMN